MTIETPSTFAFALENGDRFLLEMNDGRWILLSERDQRGFAPDLGPSKIDQWRAICRAWECLDNLYSQREAANRDKQS